MLSLVQINYVTSTLKRNIAKEVRNGRLMTHISVSLITREGYQTSPGSWLKDISLDHRPLATFHADESLTRKC